MTGALVSADGPHPLGVLDRLPDRVELDDARGLGIFDALVPSASLPQMSLGTERVVLSRARERDPSGENTGVYSKRCGVSVNRVKPLPSAPTTKTLLRSPLANTTCDPSGDQRSARPAEESARWARPRNLSASRAGHALYLLREPTLDTRCPRTAHRLDRSWASR